MCRWIGGNEKDIVDCIRSEFVLYRQKEQALDRESRYDAALQGRRTARLEGATNKFRGFVFSLL